ncbi:MAG: hypothetical protein HY427_03655 [Candidatus Levybacteria bacterium]|nr:hypothetical protein [Candidatus Levybacteria bacterium]
MEKCEFCKREDEKATASNPDQGMMWLCPDEVWICGECLNIKKRKIVMGIPL